jgi:pyrroline-5-carboxylate reductase
MILYSCNSKINFDIEADFLKILSCAGKLDKIPEGLIDAASSVSGCGPAFVYPYIEAIADGGVMAGLPRDRALRYAAQTVLGAAAMVLETGKHPGQLKDEVCSPGGSTIAGVAELERCGLRNAAASAVLASWERNKELGKS